MKEKTVILAVPLFGTPVPYDSKPARKTVIVSVSRDSEGHSLTEHHVIEDKMRNQIAQDYREALLSTLVDKGINPHSLDMIEVSKLGIDRSVDDLASYIIDHSSDYIASKTLVEPSNHN